MDGHTLNQRIHRGDADGAVDVQLGWPTVSEYNPATLAVFFLMTNPAGLPGV